MPSSVSYFLTQVSSWTWRAPWWLNWLARKPQGFTCLWPQALQLKKLIGTSGCLWGFWGSRLWSSCLHSKHTTQWVMLPVPLGFLTVFIEHILDWYPFAIITSSRREHQCAVIKLWILLESLSNFFPSAFSPHCSTQSLSSTYKSLPFLPSIPASSLLDNPHAVKGPGLNLTLSGMVDLFTLSLPDLDSSDGWAFRIRLHLCI